MWAQTIDFLRNQVSLLTGVNFPRNCGRHIHLYRWCLSYRNRCSGIQHQPRDLARARARHSSNSTNDPVRPTRTSGVFTSLVRARPRCPLLIALRQASKIAAAAGRAATYNRSHEPSAPRGVLHSAGEHGRGQWSPSDMERLLANLYRRDGKAWADFDKLGIYVARPEACYPMGARPRTCLASGIPRRRTLRSWRSSGWSRRTRRILRSQHG